MENRDQLQQKKYRWMPGVLILAGIAVILTAFFVFVSKEGTFNRSLGSYIPIKNPTTDAFLIVILGGATVVGVLLISIGLLTWGKGE